jgi:hypothetical protein
MSKDYNNFMLEKLKDTLHDILDTDLMPSEIHQCIIDTAQEDIDYYQQKLNKSNDFMKHISPSSSFSAHSEHYYDFNRNKVSSFLTIYEDPMSGELYIDIPKELGWEEGQKVEYIVQSDNSLLLKRCA